jgi:Rrf2 family protein
MLFRRPAVHGVYVLCFLGRQPAGAIVSAAQVAGAMGVPPEQTAKLLQVLQSIGLVEAIRGRAGGYRLARPLEEIPLLTVVDALTAGTDEDRLQPRSCPASSDQTCHAYHGMVAVNERVRTLLAGHSLAQLVGQECAGNGACPAQEEPADPTTAQT